MVKNESKKLPASKTPTSEIRELLVSQLLRDPHQPRQKFKKLDGLARSIKDQGLQQPIVVNFAFRKGGVDYYYIKAGERRWRSQVKDGVKTIMCVIDPKKYDGKKNVTRILEQASENSSRLSQTHGENVEVVRLVVEEEVVKRGTTHGAINAGLVRVANAFGESIGWAQKYHTLTGLNKELLEMLDGTESDDGDSRLNMQTALALARGPTEEQTDILERSRSVFEKRGYEAGLSFIVREVRKVREERGEKIRGRLHDAKRSFMRIAEGLQRLSDRFLGDRRSSAHREYVEANIRSLSPLEVDEMLGNMKDALITFGDLKKTLEAQREIHYRPYSVAKKETRARPSP
ncbi:MAG: ParB N-terminal domain-containing protein [Candidatus Paceibacterota bacterium]|jgi:hypothetical protein